jgi:hypothetical protein
VPGDDYPPITRINRTWGAKNKATIIAQTSHIPLIAYVKYGAGLVFQINSLDLGTWQFLQSVVKEKEEFSILISDIIRFLSPLGQKKRLVLKSLRQDYSLGETINLTLQSFDRNFKIAGGGDFYTEFRNRKIPFFEVVKGIYEATLIAEAKGEFSILSKGKLGEEILESNNLQISISTKEIEIEQSLNKKMLQTLAEITGGKYYRMEELENFQLPEPREEFVSRKADINSPITYFLIFALLAADWILRRIQGII